MKTRTKKRVGASAIAAVLALSLMGSSGVLNPLLASAAVPEAAGNYTSDYASSAEAQEAGRALNQEIVNEGFVLLKNDTYTPEGAEQAIASLPLAEDDRSVVLMGNAVENLVVNGSGSGAYNGNDEEVSLTQALENAGFEVQTANPNGAPSRNNTNSRAPETTESAAWEGINTAIVSVGRDSGENVMSSNSYYDLASTGMDSPNGHIMELDNNERSLLQVACNNFDNVILVLNSGNAFELDFLNDPAYENLNSIVFVGMPGVNGIQALARMLTGEVNPSGHLVDVWSSDLTQDPTWYNFATNVQVDGTHQYNNNSGRYGLYYEEGIYVGYKYYETRGYEELQDDAESTWYEDHVAYPFGYGLSYTTFDWDIISSTTNLISLGANSQITVKVRVTNTGDYAGKDVVQLYYTPPYTDGGIEKAHKNLGDFAKTVLLQPGESDVVTLNLSLREMASYDYSDANENGFAGYEADAGEYVLHIANDAHNTKLNADGEEITLTYTVNETVQFRYDETTGYEINNEFDDVSEEFEEAAGAMSRADFEATFPEGAVMTGKDQDFIDLLNESQWTYANALNSDADNVNANKYRDENNPWYYDGEVPAMNVTPEDGLIMFGEMAGLEYDDPQWDTFISQLTYDEMRTLIGSGAFVTAAVNRVGVPATTAADGPSTISNGVSYAVEIVVAATWNKDLAYRMGRAVANEGYWRDVEMWYAPAMNLHRSAFGGRNFEYYSEDGILSGKIAAEVTKGATELGLIVTLKHFAFNDQETARSTVATWMDEQAMREIYLKAFELPVKAGALGVMSAFNYIGSTWTGGSYALCTEVLRNEWGFEGFVRTDYGASSSMDLAIRGGTDLSLAAGNVVAASTGQNDPTQVYNMQKASKNILFALANSFAMHTRGVEGMPETAQGEYVPKFSDKTISMQGFEEYMDRISIDGSALGNEVTYTTTSELPNGLTLAENGIISGTPTEFGEFEIVVTASSEGFGEDVTATYTLRVVEVAVEYMNKTLSEAKVGHEYSDSVASFYVEGVEATVEATYEATNVPAGFTLDAATGIISGTPTEAGTYEIAVQATVNGQVLDATITLVVVAADAVISYEAFDIASTKVGANYSVNVARATGSSAIVYSGANVPSGLEVTEAGMLVGTPDEQGIHVIAVTASANYFEPVTVNFILKVDAADAEISYAATELASARVGVAYSANLATASGVSGISYAGNNLPEGLRVSEDGVLSGTPTTAGDYTFTVTASAAGFDSVTAEYSMSVAKGILAYNGTTLAEGKVGTPYRESVAVNTALVGITYAVKEGSALPAGLTFNAERGLITGTPSERGAYAVTIVASVEGYEDVEATFIIMVEGDVVEPGVPEVPEEPDNGNIFDNLLAGCQSVVGMGSAVVGVALAAAFVALKKKND